MVLERVRRDPEEQTFSAGVATWDGGRETMGKLIARAGQALYRARRTGRDRMVGASDPGVTMAPEILGT